MSKNEIALIIMVSVPVAILFTWISSILLADRKKRRAAINPPSNGLPVQPPAAVDRSAGLNPLSAPLFSGMAGRLNAWGFEPETMTIDVETATFAQLIAAWEDCQLCTGIEYPETEDGCGRAFKRTPILEEAMKRRFPEISVIVMKEHYTTVYRRVHAIHGGNSPLPQWAR